MPHLWNGVREIQVPEQKEFNGQLFPLVLAPEPGTIVTIEEACEWLKEQRSSVADSLVQYGVVVFRGFPLKDAYDFDKFVTSYGREAFPYIGGAAPRRRITEKVFTANEAPPEKAILFHHEMAQVPTFPSALFFFCEVPPTSGGQTALLLSNLAYQKLLEKYPTFVKDLDEKKIIYTRVLSDGDDNTSTIGRGWQSTFLTDDRSVAEKRCVEQGMSFEWLPDGCMKTVSRPTEATREDPRSGNRGYFTKTYKMPHLWNGVREIQVPEQKEFNGQLFPLVLAPEPGTIVTIEEACEWLKEQRSSVADSLVQYGVVVFRGFPLKDAYDFDKFVTSYGREAFPYIGGAAPRRRITEKVFTANEAPPEKAILFHHEMAQVPTFPSALFFFCEVPPTSGGQTALLLSNLAYQKLLEKYPTFVKDLDEKKIIYTRVLSDGDDNTSTIGRGWQSTFLTDDRSVAEKRCVEQGMSFEWLPDGCMKTVSRPTEATREDPRSGNRVLFNSIISVYRGWRDSRNTPEKAITFGDGTPMPADVMDFLEATMNDLAVDIPWQKGDVFLVDNRLAMHGRRPFVPPRVILASLIK